MRNTVCQLRKTATCCPWTGYQAGLSIVRPADLLAADSWYTLLSFLHFSPLYLHSIPCTKILCFDTCTSVLQTFHTALCCSFPSGIPWNWIPTSLAVFLPAYGCGLGTLLLLWYAPLSTRTTVVISFPPPLIFPDRIPSSDTSVQTLCGICNSTLYVISYECHSNSFECPPFVISVQLADRTSIITKGVFLSSSSP